EFIVTFDIIEYGGTVDYAPATGPIQGVVRLTQTQNVTNLLTGPVELIRSPTNRFNELAMQPGVWTNTSAQSLVFTNSVISRDTGLKTNYYGLMLFADGDPSTADPDYVIWQLSIDDLNDADAIGIPNLSD